MRRVSQQLNKSIFGSNRFLFLMASAVGVGAGVMLLNPKTVFCAPRVFLQNSADGRFTTYRGAFSTSIDLFYYGPEISNYLKLIQHQKGSVITDEIGTGFYEYLVEHYKPCLDALTLHDHVKFEEAVKKLEGSILVKGEARAAHFLIAVAVDTGDGWAKRILADHFSKELVDEIERDRGGAAPMRKGNVNAMFYERNQLLLEQRDESAKASSPVR